MKCTVVVVSECSECDVVCSLNVKEKEKLESKKKSLLGFGHKFNELGGTKVIIAYFGLYVVVCV